MRWIPTLLALGLSALAAHLLAQTDVVLPRIFGRLEGDCAYPVSRTGFRSRAWARRRGGGAKGAERQTRWIGGA